MDLVTGVLLGLVMFLGSLVASRRAHDEQEAWKRLPAMQRAALAATEEAEWLRSAGAAADAERRLARALDACRAAADASCTAVVEGALGRHLRDVGEPEEALAHFGKAGDGAAAEHRPDIEAAALDGLGSAYRDLGDPHRAAELHRRALALARASGDLKAQAEAWGGLGATYRDLGRREAALDAFSRAVELHGVAWERNRRRGGFLDGGSTAGGAIALANVGAAYHDTGNFDASLRYYGWALSAFQRIGHRRGEAITLLDIGAVHRDRGDARTALEFYERALPLLHTLRHPSGEAQAAVAIERLLADAAPGRAIFHGKQAVAAYEAMRGKLRGVDPELQELYATSVAAAYRRLAGVLAARARIPEAEEVLRLLKRQEYLEYTRRAAPEPAEAPLPWTPAEERALSEYGELSRRFDAIERDLAPLRRKRFLSLHVRDLPVDLPLGARLTRSEADRLATLEREEERVYAALRAFFAGLGAALEPDGSARPALALPDELERTLAALGDGSVAMQTLVDEDAVRIILVTPRERHAYVSPLDPRSLAAAVLAFREALEDPSKDARPAARAVYDAIVAPAAADLASAGATTIVWSLDGALRYVPVAALHDGERWLAERFQSVVYPGGSVAAIAAPPSRPWTAVGAGVTRGHERFAPLPGVAEELAAVVRGERGGGVLVGETLLDEAFTRQTFAAALEHRRPVIHVASHFVFRPGDETQSFLLLGDGSHLTLGDVRAMPSAFDGVDQVTLSACESAVQGGDGAEIDGLAVLAQRQGAAAVLASLWAIADVATPAYMREFYLRREGGLSRAAALQATQVAMIRGTLRPATHDAEGWEHPFFWAPFVLLGSGR